MTDFHRAGRNGSPRPSARPAFSLLELVATLSLLLVVAIGATSMLGSITDIGLRDRHASRERASVRRFAEAFRADVSAAVDVVTEDNDWPIELNCGEYVVEFRWDPASKQLFRLVRSDANRDGADNLLATDVYPFTDRCQPKLLVAEDRVSVILRATGGTPGWIVEAGR